MVVSGKRFMLLTSRKGTVSDLVEVYGADSLEDKAPATAQPDELDDQLQSALWQDYEARMPRLEACQYLHPKVNCEAAYVAFWRVYDRLLED